MQLDERNVDEACALIRSMDEAQLRRVIEEVQERMGAIRRAKVRKIKGQLQRGSRVKIARGIKPQYMIGATGRVEEVLQTKAKVVIDEGCYTGRFGRTIRIPMVCLEVID